MKLMICVFMTVFSLRSYADSSLVRPILAYPFAKKMELPIACLQSIKDQTKTHMRDLKRNNQEWGRYADPAHVDKDETFAVDAYQILQRGYVYSGSSTVFRSYVLFKNEYYPNGSYRHGQYYPNSTGVFSEGNYPMFVFQGEYTFDRISNRCKVEKVFFLGKRTTNLQ